MNEFLKKDISRMIVTESGIHKAFTKKEIELMEDAKSAYITPSSNSASSMASDLSKAKADNPSDNVFVTSASSYDTSTANDPVNIDVTGSSPSDLANKAKQLSQQPDVKRLIQNKDNVNFKLKMENKRRNSIPFSKSELNELLK